MKSKEERSKGNYDIFYDLTEEVKGISALFGSVVSVIFNWIFQLGAEALIIDDFYSTYTGYPFVPKASFTSNDQSFRNYGR